MIVQYFVYVSFDAKIINIERLEDGSYYFKTTVQLMTFEGPHNPPYGLETLTIVQAMSGTRVVDFNHKPYKYNCFYNIYYSQQFATLLQTLLS
ncbi:DUF3888 domain-containing protein [Alkalibaculum sp. M08DMB]|uniref:DUF3888 domain-containing protein n=1 Tax=Alkalibaculum sporogenes TaxID=2655001 RepID=A0A6A7KBT4_9FIRM|nr:DUF3888 domain-containing protein [Alkalibaculum sporogenes]